MRASQNQLSVVFLLSLGLFLCVELASAQQTPAARIKSERIAIGNSTGVFAADIVGAETIAEGSS